MGAQLKLLTVNQLEKGTVIYREEESIDNISLVVKGRVLVNNQGAKVLVGSGSFLGITDLHVGKFINSYIAYDDVIVFTFPIQNMNELDKVLSINKDYHGLMVASLHRHIVELDKIYTSLYTMAKELFMFLDKKQKEYVDLSRKYKNKLTPITDLDDIAEYDSDYIVDTNKINYYKECSKIPVEVQKEYYSYDTIVTRYHVEGQAELIVNLTTECMGIALYITDMFHILFNKAETCLFKGTAKLGIDLRTSGEQNNELVTMVDEIIAQINNIDNLFNKCVGYQLDVDRTYMEEIYCKLISDQTNTGLSTDIQMKYSESDVNTALKTINDSLKQILDFSEIDREKRENFESSILEFRNLNDKLSTEDSDRRLRKKIADIFYELYELVFLKAYKVKYVNRVIDMFLLYGYVDENLLSKEQLLELYFLKDDNFEGTCSVYNIKEWLIEIYEGRKEPSKSEFDLDYVDNLREIKKTKKLTPEEENDYLNNAENKLNYEIQNMFRYNNRVVNGQLSTFIPILYQDSIISNLKKVYLNAEKVNEVVQNLLNIDYSIFRREVLYYDESIGIKKEYIMQEVYPDIILFPMYGYNSVMWQEITGKRRNTPGRFFFPIFAEGSLEDMMIKAFGRYRWEICRSIQGIAWNDIKYKSLTSEYMDYLQFYRKNRELSEEKKEKLKQQIQKARSNSREVFVIDYEVWIKSESKGAVRLNKIVREIFATYCPFTKKLREKMQTQPLFTEAMKRFQREKARKIKEIDARYRALEKDNIEIPEVLLETQRFYTDL